MQHSELGLVVNLNKISLLGSLSGNRLIADGQENINTTRTPDWIRTGKVQLKRRNKIRLVDYSLLQFVRCILPH